MHIYSSNKTKTLKKNKHSCNGFMGFVIRINWKINLHNTWTWARAYKHHHNNNNHNISNIIYDGNARVSYII